MWGRHPDPDLGETVAQHRLWFAFTFESLIRAENDAVAPSVTEADVLNTQ